MTSKLRLPCPYCGAATRADHIYLTATFRDVYHVPQHDLPDTPFTAVRICTAKAEHPWLINPCGRHVYYPHEWSTDTDPAQPHILDDFPTDGGGDVGLGCIDYVNPWLGTTHHIYIQTHPDNLTPGYYDTADNRWMHPDQLIQHLTITRNDLNTQARRLTGYSLSDTLTQINKLDDHISQLQDRTWRRNEAARLLDHRSTYIASLTPRDRLIIERENLQLRAML